MKKLDNKTVFITGGLSGIGLACAIAAAKEGANVVVADLESDNLDKSISEIRSFNPKAEFIECNVANYNQVKSAIDKTVNNFGSCDIALNNAGIGGQSSKVSEMSESMWLEVIGVNLNGVFNCMKHQLIQMEKQKCGVIVNMSSILGKVGFANASHYVASKHGVIGLTQAAAMEYAPMGIRINAICPGFIQTPLLTKSGIVENSEFQHAIMNLHPMKRLGVSEEVAAGFIFLASEESSFITGSSLDIDGGYLCQ
jgi:NAD(P)-dependent dehydrogenase (short-subunit alcohol dehydrogenase family)